MVENWKNPKILQTEWKTVIEGTGTSSDSSWWCLQANDYGEEFENDREPSSHKNQEDGCVVRFEFLLLGLKIKFEFQFANESSSHSQRRDR